ncbi:hypothetical protein AB0D56_38650, partial [Streptomyces sp. NPDC048209]|uniref:hypothetical protein n=1 Tax=Streptomyces sp. NPDC048209 TaxID=3156689 RepID=UPI0034180E20
LGFRGLVGDGGAAGLAAHGAGQLGQVAARGVQQRGEFRALRLAEEEADGDRPESAAGVGGRARTAAWRAGVGRRG